MLWVKRQEIPARPRRHACICTTEIHWSFVLYVNEEGWLNTKVCAQGFAVQGYVTGEGPYANWAKHVSDPCAPSLLLMHAVQLHESACLPS